MSAYASSSLAYKCHLLSQLAPEPKAAQQLAQVSLGPRLAAHEGSGYAKDITFQNMIMYNVKNPIIIDQNYCDKARPCKEQRSAVQISNVVFKNVRGTTVTKDAIKMSCSENVPCQGITLQNIDLKMQGGKGHTESTCQNAKWRKSGKVVPQPCTSKNKGTFGHLLEFLLSSHSLSSW